MRLAAPVVDEQVLGEEARRDHPRAVVHEALAEQLAGSGVDDGIAGLADHPRLPQAPRRTAKESPTKRRPKRLREQLGPIPQRAVGELAPDELVEEAARRRRFVEGTVDRGPHLSRGDGAELEIRRQSTRAGEVHAIALLGVRRGGMPQEPPEPRPRGLLASGQDRRVALDAELFAGREGQRPGANVPRHRRQHARRRQGLADHRRLTKHARKLAEHRVGVSGSRSQRARRHQRLALVQLELGAESLAHAPVALARRRLDPSLRDHAIDLPFAGETRDDLHALARDDDEARATLGERAFERAQRVEQELHAVRQLARARGREEVGVEHEQRDDLAGAQRVAERRMVRDAQVLAAKPDDGPRGHLGFVAVSRRAIASRRKSKIRSTVRRTKSRCATLPRGPSGSQ